MFEGKDHVSVYQRYRFTPPNELKNIILQYLDKKKGQPHVLAVDLGCGTGQNSRLLAPHFQEVVGLDVSECQVEEARAVPGYPNITYRKGTAEELPFPDGSSAAHWFDPSRFLAEASQVLKPRGSMALLSFIESKTRLHYQDCGGRLTDIYKEEGVDSSFMEVGIEHIQETSSVSVRNLVGFIESWSMFQACKRKDPQAAEDLLLNTQKRFLEEMGVTSPDTEIEQEQEYFCVLATKPQ